MNCDVGEVMFPFLLLTCLYLNIQLKFGFAVLFSLTIPDAISLANFTLWIHGKGSSMSWRRSFSVPPGIYSVTRFSLLSLYNTPRNLRACGWSKFRNTETWNITWHHYLQFCMLFKLLIDRYCETVTVEEIKYDIS